MNLPKAHLTHLAGLIRGHWSRIGSRWRRLTPAALLALARLRAGETLARLAAWSGVGATTAWRYVREAVDQLATRARRAITTAAKARVEPPADKGHQGAGAP